MEKSNAVYLTPAELSARWKGKPTVGTLRTWRHRGVGPAPTRIGKSVLYALEAVEAYEREHLGHRPAPAAAV